MLPLVIGTVFSTLAVVCQAAVYDGYSTTTGADPCTIGVHLHKPVSTPHIQRHSTSVDQLMIWLYFDLGLQKISAYALVGQQRRPLLHS